MLVARKIFRGPASDPGKIKGITKITMLRNLLLVLLWSGMFVYGMIETTQGWIPLNRVLPAGAFLLLFIGILGWARVQDIRGSRA